MSTKSTNKSAAITTMHTTLTSIQRVRRLLARESDHLSEEVYSEVEQHLKTLEYGLSKAMAQYGAYQYTKAPNLRRDDEEEQARFWKALVTRARRKR